MTAWGYIYSHYPNFYEQYWIFTSKIIVLVIYQFIFATFMVFAFFNHYQIDVNVNSFQFVALISFIINILVGGSLLLLFMVLYHQNKDWNGISNVVCDLSIIISDDNCYIYYWCVYLPFCFVLTILVNYLTLKYKFKTIGSYITRMYETDVNATVLVENKHINIDCEMSETNSTTHL